MSKTIKSKIILSNIMIVFASLFILLLMIFTLYVKESYSLRSRNINDILIQWKVIESDMYLTMNRWLLGVPFENIKNSVNLIDKKLVNLNMNSKTSLLTPTNLRKEIENMQNLWDHSKKGLIYPIILKIENFVISKIS